MNPNIRAAAASLRRAANEMQSRIRQLQAGEYDERQHESQTEYNLDQDMRKTEVEIATEKESSDKKVALARRDVELHQQRSKAKDQSVHHIDDMEKEIRSLQGQISRLNEIARTLESW